MPQTISHFPSHSPPHLILVPTHEAIAAPTLDLAFSTPSPPPHAPNVEEDIMRYKSKEDESLEVIATTPEPLHFEHSLSRPVVGGPFQNASLASKYMSTRSTCSNMKDKK